MALHTCKSFTVYILPLYFILCTFFVLSLYFVLLSKIYIDISTKILVHRQIIDELVQRWLFIPERETLSVFCLYTLYFILCTVFVLLSKIYIPSLCFVLYTSTRFILGTRKCIIIHAIR